MEDREIYELQQLCTTGGLSQDSLGALIDANLSVPQLVRSEAAAMAAAKKAGLGLADRQKLREALRKYKDDVLSSEQLRILEIGDDAEVWTTSVARVRNPKGMNERLLARVAGVPHCRSPASTG